MARVGMIGGSYNPLHNGHVKCIQKALQQCDELHVIIGDLPNRGEFDIETKLSWFTSIFHDQLDRLVLHPFLDETADKKDYGLQKWLDDSVKIKDLIGKPIDVVFCGADYNRPDNPYFVCYPDQEIVYFDRDDQINSTEIRENPEGHKDWVPDVVYDSLTEGLESQYIDFER